jgi:hypothetical protein
MAAVFSGGEIDIFFGWVGSAKQVEICNQAVKFDHLVPLPTMPKPKSTSAWQVVVLDGKGKAQRLQF